MDDKIRVLIVAGNAASEANLFQLLGEDRYALHFAIDGCRNLELSGTAARIFEAMICSYPRLTTHEQPQEHLRGGDDADMNTLRTHIYVLRKQLQQAFHVSLIKTLRGRGYRLVPPGED